MAGIGVVLRNSGGGSSSSSSASWQHVTISRLAAIGFINFILVWIVLQANPHTQGPAFSKPSTSNPNVTSSSWGEELAAAVAAAWRESSGLLRGGLKEAARDGEQSSGGPTLGVGGFDPFGLSKEAAAAATAALDFDAVGVAEWMPKLDPFEPPPGSDSFFEGHSEEAVIRYLEDMSWDFKAPVEPADAHADEFDQLAVRLRSVARDELRNATRQLANRPLLFGGPCPPRDFDPHIFQLLGRFSLGVLPWKPQESKFLLYNCHYGELSNQMQCLRKTLLLAGLLNRTLLIDMTHPELQYHHPYNRSLFFDIDHFRHCLGESVLVTTDEYRQKYGQEIKIDESIILGKNDDWLSSWIPADVTGVPEREVNLTQPSIAEIVREFRANNASILHFGDLIALHGIYAKTWLFGQINDVPFIRLNSSKCFSLVQPAREVFEAAKKFIVRRMNSQPFVCVHWRRGDFKFYCQQQPKCCVSIANLSRSLHEAMAKYNVRNVVLVTNAESSEVETLKSQLYMNHSLNFPTVVRRVHLRNLIGTNKFRDEYLALVEKLVCAMSSIFLSNLCSSFSSEISRYRTSFKMTNCLDSFSWQS